MAINYKNLDERTRTFMVQEVELDISNGNLYLSTRFSGIGKQLYPSLLLDAVKFHDDDWLKNELNNKNCFKSVEVKHTKSGNATIARTPNIAGETLAEGQFNRFYMRGVCLRAEDEGIFEVLVYRGKSVAEPRPESQGLIGSKITASVLLEDLRCPPGSQTRSGLSSSPNSGITICL